MLAPVYIYAAKVISVHDGDTLRVRVDCGFGIESTVWIRMEDVFAPELRQAMGVLCRDNLRELLPIGAPVVIQTRLLKFDGVTARFAQSFIRYIGVVYSGEVNINAAMAEFIGTPAGIGAGA